MTARKPKAVSETRAIGSYFTPERSYSSSKKLVLSQTSNTSSLVTCEFFKTHQGVIWQGGKNFFVV